MSNYIPVCFDGEIKYARVIDKQEAIDELLDKRLDCNNEEKPSIDYALELLNNPEIQVLAKERLITKFEYDKIRGL